MKGIRWCECQNVATRSWRRAGCSASLYKMHIFAQKNEGALSESPTERWKWSVRFRLSIPPSCTVCIPLSERQCNNARWERRIVVVVCCANSVQRSLNGAFPCRIPRAQFPSWPSRSPHHNGRDHAQAQNCMSDALCQCDCANVSFAVVERCRARFVCCHIPDS